MQMAYRRVGYDTTLQEIDRMKKVRKKSQEWQQSRAGEFAQKRHIELESAIFEGPDNRLTVHRHVIKDSQRQEILLELADR
jgi:hypothetical protein